MKNLFVFIFVFCFLTSSVYSQKLPDSTFFPGVKTHVFFFPHFVVGGGTEYIDEFRLKDGYEFGVIFRSLFDSGGQVHLSWWGSDGQRFAFKEQLAGNKFLSDAIPHIGIGMAPHGSLQNIYSLPIENTKTGWVMVEISDEAGKSSAEVSLQFRYKVNGQVVGQATVSPVQPSQRMSLYERRYTDPGQDLSETGVAVANPYDVPAVVTFTRRSRNGYFVDSCVAVVPPLQQLVLFVGQICKPLDRLVVEGSLEITSSVPVVALALQTTGDAGSFNFSTLPVYNYQ